MKKSVLISTITIFLIVHSCPIFAAGGSKVDYYLSAAPLSVHFAESKSREATGYGFGAKSGFELHHTTESRLFYGAELSANVCSFDTYKHFDYKDAVLIGKIGYRFLLNTKWSLNPSFKAGVFIGFLDGETDYFAAMGGDVSFDYVLSKSKKLVLSESVIYVFQNNAHSVLLNTSLGLKFALSGRGTS